MVPQDEEEKVVVTAVARLIAVQVVGFAAGVALGLGYVGFRWITKLLL